MEEDPEMKVAEWPVVLRAFHHDLVAVGCQESVQELLNQLADNDSLTTLRQVIMHAQVACLVVWCDWWWDVFVD
jgi:hypothetical protein